MQFNAHSRGTEATGFFRKDLTNCGWDIGDRQMVCSGSCRSGTNKKAIPQRSVVGLHAALI